MKYTIIKFFTGDLELVINNKKDMLTDENPAITVNEDEYEVILEKYQSMIVNRMILVQRVEIKQENKKFNK